MPGHVGIIMGGNRRRTFEHGEAYARGVERSLEIIRISLELGIETLSLYAFSTESRQNPEAEVSKVFRLLETYLKTNITPFIKKGVRFRVIGSREHFSLAVNTLIRNAEKVSAKNPVMTVNLALGYGGKHEVVRAANRAIEAAEGPVKMTEELLEENLDTAGLSPVDLIIRAGGERRISNFMIWQAAYAELYFTDVPWLDFDSKEYQKALKDYAARKHRFELVEVV